MIHLWNSMRWTVSAGDWGWHLQVVCRGTWDEASGFLRLVTCPDCLVAADGLMAAGLMMVLPHGWTTPTRRM